jgi:hypothetical protein
VLEGLRESPIQSQQAKDWRNHEERRDRRGEPRVAGIPNQGKCSGLGGWLLGGDGNVQGYHLIVGEKQL